MRQIWVSCILLSTAASSVAATLGVHSGVAVIGRPLDMSVQVLLAAGEDTNALCVRANVFYGDSQVPSAQVRSTLQRTPSNAESFVRVQVFQTVNEPIVTVDVRAGCDAPFNRRFVLLAQLATEPLVHPSLAPTPENTLIAGFSPASDSPSALKDGLGRAGAGGLTGQSMALASAPPDGAQAEPGPISQSVRSVQASQPVVAAPRIRPPSAVRRPAPVRAASTPRLQLDLFDLAVSVEHAPVLKLSTALLSEPATSEEARAASALLWKAVNASPEDVLRDQQKMLVLETESKGLREAYSQSQTRLAELNRDLQRAKASRYTNWLMYSLAAGLLLSLLALALLWRRRHVAAPNAPAKSWWTSERAAKEEKSASKMGLSGFDDDAGAPFDPPSKTATTDDIDAQQWRRATTGFGQAQPGLAQRDEARPPFTTENTDRFYDIPGVAGESRSVAIEDLFDIQQQADFFVSLGDDQRAIQLLRSHLLETRDPSAMAYLDLLKIYHRLGRKSDYKRACEEFNHLFNTGAPAFEQYVDSSHGLEAYENPLRLIQALWPQPGVLDVIEQFIFRSAKDDQSELFDLEAYRELLLLHAMAKDIIQSAAASGNAGQQPTEFQFTAAQPLSASDQAAVAAEQRDTPAVGAMVLPAFQQNLDIDLDDLSAFDLAQVPLPSDVDLSTAAPAELKDNLIDFQAIDFTTDIDDKLLNP